MAGAGEPETGGRQAGTPNKMTASVKAAILAAFDEVGGEAYLVKVANEDPRTFCTLLGKVLPTELVGADDEEGQPQQIRVINVIGVEPREPDAPCREPRAAPVDGNGAACPQRIAPDRRP